MTRLGRDREEAGPRLRPVARHKGRGQSLVEFALVFPLFIMLLLAVIEFAFMFAATLSVNNAARDASLIAAEAGSDSAADCLVLQKVGNDISAPEADSQIQSVTIFQVDRAGHSTGLVDTYQYTSSGSYSCSGWTQPAMPYTSPSPNSYQSVNRCNIIAGCLISGSDPPAFNPLDSIGVKIVYRYTYVTPLRNLLRFLPGWSVGYVDFTWSNVMRMEPVL